VLNFIGTIQNIDADEAYLVFAGLDMQPRLGMAAHLCTLRKLPPRFRKRLDAIRRQLQKSGGGLAELRNLYVHGVHEPGDVEGEFTLMMSRERGDKRRRTVTFLDVMKLANQLELLAQEMNSIFLDYGTWKFGIQHEQNGHKEVAQTKASLRLIRAQQIKRALKLLFSNLKP
jgi:hypothetical protein